jgi:hypothetical protein
LDVYRAQINCRYTNIYALWSEVHITSIIPPEKTYENMVQQNRNIDTVDQLLRRIDFVVYHEKKNDQYTKNEIPIEIYENRHSQVMDALKQPEWIREQELQMIMEDYSTYELPY